MSDVSFTISFDSNGGVVLRNIKSALDETKGAFAGAAPSFEVPANALDALQRRGLCARQALGMVASSIAGMGEAGHIAASGLITATAGVGIIGVGVATAATAIALLVEHFKAATDAAENFRQAVRTGDLGFFVTEIDKADQKLVSLMADLDSLRRGQAGGDDFWSRFTLSADRAATKQRQIGETVAEQAKTVAAQQDILAKSFGDTTLQIEFQTEAIGKSIAEQAELANELRITQAMQHGLANASRETKDALIAKSYAHRDATVADDARKTTVEFQNQSLALQIERSLLNASALETIALSAASKINAIQTSDMARFHRANADALIEETKATSANQQVLKAIQMGQTGVSNFEQQFGVQFDFSKMQTGSALAEKFMSGFSYAIQKGDSASLATLNQAFGSFVQQAVAMGLPDIGGLLLSKGMTPAQLASLESSLAGLQTGIQEVQQTTDLWTYNAVGGSQKVGEEISTKLVPVFGDSLVAAIDRSAQAGKVWGDSFMSETQKVTGFFFNIGQQLDSFQRQANAAIDSVIQKILSVPPIVIDVYYAMSPKKPFSEFLPTMQSKFSSLADIVKNSTPDILLKVPNVDQRLGQMQSLAAQIYWLQQAIQLPVQYGISSLQDPGSRDYAVFLATQKLAGLQSQYGNLAAGLRQDLGNATPSAGSSSGGSSGGGAATVNIDLRGSSMSRDFLDAELIPALERGIIRATGQDPKFRVLN